MYPGDTIHIFDAGRDRFVKIEYKDALKRNLAAFTGTDPANGQQLDLSGLYKRIKSLAEDVDTQTDLSVDALKDMLNGTRTQDQIDQKAGKPNVGGQAANVGDGGDTINELIAAFPTLLLLRPFQTWRMAR